VYESEGTSRMTQEIAKYNVHTKAHKRKLIKRWLIAIVVLAIIIWAFDVINDDDDN
jgi:phosphonate transport system permease protein